MTFLYFETFYIDSVILHLKSVVVLFKLISSKKLKLYILHYIGEDVVSEIVRIYCFL